MATSSRFCWNEPATTDSAVCARFFGEIFGRTGEKQTGHVTYKHFQSRTEDVAGMLQRTADPAGVRPHRMPRIAVDDYARRAADPCCKVCVPPTNIAAGRFSPSRETFPEPRLRSSSGSRQ